MGREGVREWERLGLGEHGHAGRTALGAEVNASRVLITVPAGFTGTGRTRSHSGQAAAVA